MNETASGRETPASNIIGWCVLAAGIGQIPLMIAGYSVLDAVPGVGKLLLLLSVPLGLILIIGGIGLILHKYFGYYCIYLATFFGGFGGLKVSYIPFIQRWIKIGPATEDLFLALNLILVGILVWEHWNRVFELEPFRRNIHRAAIIILLVLGLGSVGFGRAMIQHDKGEVQSAVNLPVIGSEFADFSVAGPIPYVSVHTKMQHGITLVFAGRSTEDSVKSLAETHGLKQMTDPAAHKKFLPVVKSWNLNKEKFPSAFSPDDLYYVGRLKNAHRVTLQLVYRKSDRRFTAQVFGILPK